MNQSSPPSVEQPVADAETRADRLRAAFSRASLVVAIALLAATFLLLSPPRGQTYPGAIPWSDLSILRPLTELLSLGGLVATARGVEIKQLALHVACVLGLLVVVGRIWCLRGSEVSWRRLRQPWFGGQLLLAGWVLLSGLSALWSGDPPSSFGQAALYGLALLWALGLAWTLDTRHVPWLLAALVIVSAVASILCIWYYHERNPHHRPGFPIGNPGQLAAVLMPAIIIAAGTLAGGVARWWQMRRVAVTARMAGAAVALVPMVWCFLLTNSRSAMLGLAVGLGTLVLFQLGRRMRWAMLVVMLLGIAGAGTWLTNTSRFDAAMARGATIRFRYYAWRYAAELWSQSLPTSVIGQGAGSYPRLAGQLSIRDRTLDPEAFPGELVEHAHNELFEVLTEIGLIGGVTFVGGWLATLAAGAALRRSVSDREKRWLHAALVAGLMALIVDMFSWPALRLSGVPAIFYTLLGAVWATCRCASRPEAADAIAAVLGDSARSAGRRPPQVVAAGVLAAALAAGAGWLTVRNWVGVVHEEAGQFAAAQGDVDSAVDHLEQAAADLLDPVRQLISDGKALQNRLAAARGAYLRCAAEPPESAEREELRQEAIERCREAYAAAGRLSRRVPTQIRVGASAASAAEMLGALYASDDVTASEEWYQRAMQAWYVQRRWRPFDVETLLSLTRLTLTRHNAPMWFHVGTLRDALRSPPVWPEWHAALRRLASLPGFAETLEQFLIGVGPVSSETDLDALIASLAPETCRLAAHTAALRGDFEEAQRLAERAAALYASMRPRFPTLESVALQEQAEFALRESPDRAELAVELLRQAIAQLPVIQQQKYDALALPLRSSLVPALLAAGREGEATDVLRGVLDDEALIRQALAEGYVQLASLYIRRPSEQRGPVQEWLAAALRHKPDSLSAWAWTAWLAAERRGAEGVEETLSAAARAGVGPDDLGRIRASLDQEFAVPSSREADEGE